MSKKLNDYLFYTPLDFFKKNRIDLCRVVGCGNSSGGDSGVTTFNTRDGDVTLTSLDVTTALTYTPAPTNSPTFTGVPAGPTAANGTYTTQLATTEFVYNALNGVGVVQSKVKGGQTPFTADDTTTVLDITHNLGAVPTFYSITTSQPISSNHLNRTITFPDNNTMRLTFGNPPLTGEDANYVWVVYNL